jgi:tetratricopeptide (TPR) repeat protein
LHALGRLHEAGSCFHEAIRLKPGLPAAHVGLAGVLEELGETDQSLAALREALRHDPQHAGALARLAARLKAKLPDRDRATIESLLAKADLVGEGRWLLRFGLAQAFDAMGEFDRAARLTIEANSLRSADFRRRGLGYDPKLHQRLVDQIIAAFTPEFFARVRGFGLESEKPVFIVGMPRSGTTLTEQVLASHPRVFGAGETRLVRETWDALPAATGHSDAPLACLQHLDRDSTRHLARRHLGALEALDLSADRILDKMPDNTLYLGLIATLFPRAKLIHCRRDLRDVALSCWMTELGSVHWASDPQHIVSRIGAYRRVMDHWRRVLPVRVLDVDYEAMVAEPERVSRELVTWCGLEWHPACLEFHKTRRPIRTASAAQVREPIYDRSIGRWKNYARSLAPLFVNL